MMKNNLITAHIKQTMSQLNWVANVTALITGEDGSQTNLGFPKEYADIAGDGSYMVKGENLPNGDILISSKIKQGVFVPLHSFIKDKKIKLLSGKVKDNLHFNPVGKDTEIIVPAGVLHSIEVLEDSEFEALLTYLPQPKKQSIFKAENMTEAHNVYLKTKQNLQSVQKAIDEGFSTAGFFYAFPTLPIIKIVTDAEDHTLVSSSWKHHFGYPPNSLADFWQNMIHPEDLDITIQANEKAHNGEYVTNLVNRFRTIKGEYKRVQWFYYKDPKTQLMLCTGILIDEMKPLLMK